MFLKKYYFQGMVVMKYLLDTIDINQLISYHFYLSLIFLKNLILILKIKILIDYLLKILEIYFYLLANKIYLKITKTYMQTLNFLIQKI